jgi:hypothetical protein
MPGRATFGLEVLRAAVRQRVSETSIRAVAAELGMSHSGLHVFLGGTKPHPSTRAKLVSWYVEQRRRSLKSDVEVSDGDVDAAIRLLLQYVRQDGRPAARDNRVTEIIRRLEKGSKS